MLLSFAALALLAATTPVSARTAAPTQPVDLATAELIDLTHSFDATTLYWPTSPTTFELQRLSFGPTPAGFFYAANTFSAPEHGGTHLDAPIHFAAGGAPAGTMVLLRTGWSARWPDRKRYFGDDRAGDASNLHFPSYGAEAAALLVQGRQIGVLGVDTASIDYGPSRDFPVHRLSAAAGVPGLENLTALERLPPTGAWVLALPMKIGGGSGGPLRAVALVPR